MVFSNEEQLQKTVARSQRKGGQTSMLMRVLEEQRYNHHPIVLIRLVDRHAGENPQKRVRVVGITRNEIISLLVALSKTFFLI
jgi:menaquinone-dependent protoporphyrinogen IX oxidase